MSSWQIGEVAKLAKVSIRTLHHYDAIGLLQPSLRSDAGYRFYSADDLQKLQLIRFYRTLEFPLTDIKAILSAPDYSREAILLQQRELLRARAGELDAALTLIETTLAEMSGHQETTMGNEAMFEVFPELDENLQAEAEQRWGHTDSWKQSAARSARYTKADWQRMKDEMTAHHRESERVFSAGFAPQSQEAMAVAEQGRLLIDKWHYDCTRQFHANLSAMTSTDPRFVANIDRNCPGLAAWLHEASKANAQR